MLEIIRTYIFDGIEHTSEDSIEELDRDASLIVEKIANVPVAITVKARSSCVKNKPENEEIIKMLKESGNYTMTVECQTYNFA